MLFSCFKCKFVFNRTEKPEVCPGCGCELIMNADEEERTEYEKLSETKDKKRKREKKA